MEDKNINEIMKIICIKGKLKLLSPLLIGNGEPVFTDNDLVKDINGNPFIPGTSIAGSIRNYMEKFSNENNRIIDTLFGGESKDSKQNKDSNQSLLYFYDSILIKEGTITIRDGIAVDDFIKVEKAEEHAKYDYQVLERDNEFDFRLELHLRNKFSDKKEDILKALAVIISELQRGNIYIGAKSNRGLGNIKLTNVEILKFDFDELKLREKLLKEFLKFNWDKEFNKVSEKAFESGIYFMDMIRNCKSINTNTHIKIPLKVRDTIFIRDYLLQNTDVDSSQLKYNDRFIIPGTTWAGAVKHKMFIILYDLGLTEEQTREKIEELFGCADKKKEAMASKIRFEESMDSDRSKFIDIRRTRIDRFTGGACNKALFEGRAAVHGNIFLDIYIKDKNQWKIGLLILSLYDLMSGMLAVGGETAVGRGLIVSEDDFSINGESILIDEHPLSKEDEKIYFKCLKEEIDKSIRR